jgi:hypothetical protein
MGGKDDLRFFFAHSVRQVRPKIFAVLPLLKARMALSSFCALISSHNNTMWLVQPHPKGTYRILAERKRHAASSCSTLDLYVDNSKLAESASYSSLKSYVALVVRQTEKKVRKWYGLVGDNATYFATKTQKSLL